MAMSMAFGVIFTKMAGWRQKAGMKMVSSPVSGNTGERMEALNNDDSADHCC